jgi:Kef-type K+ transport system membrane component KefB
MVGAFLAGVVMDADWLEQEHLDTLFQNVLLALMPVFFLSTGLRAKWDLGDYAVFFAAGLLQTKGLIEIIFANILLDKQIITSETFTALVLMAVGSTMLTVPVVHPKLNRVQHRGLVNQASS